jgi:hypothetical protein
MISDYIHPISAVKASDLLPEIDHEPTMDDVIQSGLAGNAEWILEAWKKKYYSEKGVSTNWERQHTTGKTPGGST